jgi:hypothetical protein
MPVVVTAGAERPQGIDNARGEPTHETDPRTGAPHHPNIEYRLRLEEPRPRAGEPPADVTEVGLNRLVGRPIRLEHTGEFTCIRCGRGVDKLFGEGYCYPCFRDAPEAAECIVKPELCEAHLGRGRDPQWEEAHHNQPHAVYLAVSSALKVGVTRLTQIPTRWVDQGAAWAVQIAEVPYRQLAGRIEVALKELYTDRTAWQRMLKGQLLEDVDLAGELARIREHIGSTADGAELLPYIFEPARLRPHHLVYPLPEPPEKVKSVNLQKSPVVESTLTGIRGQYLIFDGGAVLNVRRHSGFHVTLEA